MTPSPATFDTAPGSYPRGEAVERPAKQMAQRIQRPQDFAVPSRPKKYQEEQPLIGMPKISLFSNFYFTCE